MTTQPLIAPAELVDIAGAARILATTERHIRQLQARRQIPWSRIGGKVRFDVADLAAYVAAQRVPAAG